MAGQGRPWAHEPRLGPSTQGVSRWGFPSSLPGTRRFLFSGEIKRMPSLNQAHTSALLGWATGQDDGEDRTVSGAGGRRYAQASRPRHVSALVTDASPGPERRARVLVLADGPLALQHWAQAARCPRSCAGQQGPGAANMWFDIARTSANGPPRVVHLCSLGKTFTGDTWSPPATAWPRMSPGRPPIWSPAASGCATR